MSGEKELEPQIEKLFTILKGIHSEKLIDGFTFQVGWGVYYLHEKENRVFTITTPDYSKDPFEDKTEDLTLALWVQLKQGHFLGKLNITGLSIKFNDEIILSKGVLELKNIYLQRSGNVEQGDSGWYIGAVEDSDSTELYALYAFQLLKLITEIIQVLALPVYYMVVFEDKEIKAVLDEHDEDVIV